ncbi:hypothetical protein Hypma_011895 [Hypsizygus marmoreus]|uniref:Uncharacterized protein n=1 Tax=Hypsizygus marmoreus TaxID=39966 RepID=A0A369JLP8_HYPMA|nr:hypothetical protein Hypma_011895 [Hypsizygus marmoreus]
MLLRFTAPDMLNSALVDVSTGERAYDIVTVLLPPKPESEQENDDPTRSSQDRSTKEQRRTCIADPSGATLVSISWNGRHPDIVILDEKVGGLADLFGSSTVRFMPKILAVPTRFDTEYVWTATPHSLTLFDYDSETTKGTFYQNSIRLSTPFRSKAKLSSTAHFDSDPNPSTAPSSPLSSSSSLHSSASSALTSNASSPCICAPSHPRSTPTDCPKSSFISTYLPGVGSNYLEFCHHPLAHDIEIIVSFLMMEILRRGRFVLTPYTFEKPNMWQLKETRDLVLRRLRRYTV